MPRTAETIAKRPRWALVPLFAGHNAALRAELFAAARLLNPNITGMTHVTADRVIFQALGDKTVYTVRVSRAEAAALGYMDDPRAKMTVMLAGAEGVPAARVPAATTAQAGAQVRAYIETYGLSASELAGGELRLDGKVIGRISYNGRAWDVDGNEM